MSTTANEQDLIVPHNTYFNGKVQSLALLTEKGRATVGVMKKGLYTFSTAAAEQMVIVSGTLNVKLNGADWTAFHNNESFGVEANSSFEVSCDADVAYFCYYLD